MNKQEEFWNSDFGDEYLKRNEGQDFLANQIVFLSHISQKLGKVNSILEFGCNVGYNLEALGLLYPRATLTGVELNKSIAEVCKLRLPEADIFTDSINSFDTYAKYDLVLSKGLLIHINPDELPEAYDKLYKSSKKYIVIAEYYNPKPVSIEYHGQQDKLFKRDFASEMLDRFPDLKLIDYGFVWRGDKFPQDDVTYFIFEK